VVPQPGFELVLLRFEEARIALPIGHAQVRQRAKVLLVSDSPRSGKVDLRLQSCCSLLGFDAVTPLVIELRLNSIGSRSLPRRREIHLLRPLLRLDDSGLECRDPRVGGRSAIIDVLLRDLQFGEAAAQLVELSEERRHDLVIAVVAGDQDGHEVGAFNQRRLGVHDGRRRQLVESGGDELDVARLQASLAVE
jgi:hypothetical protein